MAIAVSCPACHTRFQVSEKFAGRTGPCPKCKNKIAVPKAEEAVKIHERAHEGVKDAKGKLVLKPIARTEVKINPLAAAALGVWTIAAVGVSWVTAGSVMEPQWAWLLGAALLAPPLVQVGYGFLRNDELEPYTGTAALFRVAVCSLVYAALWAAFYGLVPEELRSYENNLVSLSLVLAPMIAAGVMTAFGALDLEAGNAFFHYALYLLVTVALRAALGLPAV